MKKILILAGISLVLGVAITAQTRGTPANIRVKIDANGALVVASAVQVNPVSTVQFNNSRLALDASGNLLVTGLSSSFAPIDATYITQIPNATLTNEQALSVLPTGLMNITTTTGVVSSIVPTDDNILIGNGTVWQLKAFTSCSGANNAVTYNTTTNILGCNTINASPAGANFALQYYNSGEFGPATGIDYIAANKALAFSGNIPAMTNPVTIAGGDAGGGNANLTFNTADAILRILMNKQLILTTADTASITSGGDLNLASGPGKIAGLIAGSNVMADGGDVDITSGMALGGNGGNIVLTLGSGLFGTDGHLRINNLFTSDPSDGLWKNGNVLVNTGNTTPTFTTTNSGAFITSITSPAVGNIGMNSCGTTAATISGTDNAWQFTVGATSGTACRVTFDTTAPNTWECTVGNKSTLTLNATPHQTASTNVTVDITATLFVAGDKIGGVCFAR